MTDLKINSKPLKILIIKLTSLGDLIHTFPALTEAQQALPQAEFHWLVDESFAQIPGFHPAIQQVHTIPLRKKKWRAVLSKIFSLRRTHSYDLIIDAQGLFKSALLGSFLKAPKHGLNYASAREPLATFLYQHRYEISKNQHAIDRLRSLFSKILNYPINLENPIHYGLDASNSLISSKKKILFLHGTTWETKHWPKIYWVTLGQQLASMGFEILLPWGNELEKKHAENFQSQFKSTLLPKLSLLEFKTLLQKEVRAVVAQDTGLTHLAAALDIPTISLYGPTDSKKTGPKGKNQIILSAQFSCAPCLSRTCSYPGSSPYPKDIHPPCFGSIPPKMVYDSLLKILETPS